MTSNDEIERARLEGAREALTAYAEAHSAPVALAFRDANYPAPKPPLPTAPGSLLRLNHDNDHFAVLRGGNWYITGVGMAWSEGYIRHDYPDAVEVIAKTPDEWAAEKADVRREALTEALAVLGADGLMSGYSTYDAIRALRDGGDGA
jgi:hypothetical protein